jgi:D-3-phosphoglycerate dehydrogenase
LKALVTAEIIKEELLKLQDAIDFQFDGYCVDHKMLDPEEFKKKCEDVDVIISEFDTISEEVLFSAKNLKLIICCRAGVNTVIDLDAAKRRGVMVCNNVGRNASSAADFTIALILDLVRNISKTNQLIHDRVLTTSKKTMPLEYQDSLWGLSGDSPYIEFRGRSLSNMTLGLVGFGCVGQLVAKRAHMFGMRVIISDPNVDSSTIPKGIERVNFETLLKRSDIVSLHCSGNPQLKHMISFEEFKMMKGSAYFINIARGNLVNEEALLQALNNGYIKGAALDVISSEPMPPDHPLLEAKNLIITPHIAGSSTETQYEGTRMVIDALKNFLQGIPPKNCIID